MTKNNNSGDKINIAIIATKVDAIQQTVKDIQGKLEADFVTRAEFDPVKKIVYGMVGLILTIVFTALVYLVIRKP